MDLDVSSIEDSRRCAPEAAGLTSLAVDPERLGGPMPVRDAGTVDRHDVHKDPASSAASRWTLASMYLPAA